MSDPKLISSFEQFERIYEAVESGETPMNEDEINEGIFSGIMNFFSRVFGGRVTDLDKILKKYRRNEADYWKRWAEANHEYNKAAAKRETSEDPIDQRKHLEMMERANKLMRQTTKTRHEVNDALERQAMLKIRGNRRLRRYWEVKKAKVDEDVANKSYTTLKKEVDEDTLDELYDRVKETQAEAKKQIKKMPKGTMTIEFGKYPDRSAETKEMPFNKFGIHDIDDFVFAEDELWDQRIALMPDANKEQLAKRIEELKDEIDEDTKTEVKKIKKDLETAKDEERKRLEKDLDNAITAGEQDIETLDNRLAQLSGVAAPKKKADDTTSEPEPEDEDMTAFERRLKESRSKVEKRVGDVGDKEIDLIMGDMLAIYDKLPDQDKDEDKEEDIRMVQLIDFSKDIYKYRQENQVSGVVSGAHLTNLYNAFKKEFPK